MSKELIKINEHTNDEVLLALIKDNNQKAYRILVDRYLGKLWRLSVNVLRNEGEADEVVQEALLTVWKNREKWVEGKAKFSTWVYRITLNRCIDLKRRRRPTTSTQSIEETMASEDNPGAENIIIQKEKNNKLKKMLDELPQKQKNALILYYYEELNIKEISDKISTTEQGARSLLKRGRKNLKDLLTDDSKNEYRTFQGTP